MMASIAIGQCVRTRPHTRTKLKLSLGRLIGSGLGLTVLLPCQLSYATTLADIENRTTRIQAPIANTAKIEAQYQDSLTTIDDNLASRILQMAQKSRDPSVINPYLQMLAKHDKPSANEADILRYRAAFYQQQLQSLSRSELSPELFYEQARTYDQLGESQLSADTLLRLIQLFPQSAFQNEINFRLAENYFALHQYPQAQQYYQQVLAFGDSKLMQPSRYGLAWSYYKNDQLAQAMPILDDLIRSLQAKPSLNKGDSVLLNDCFATMALVFVQSGGSSALQTYYGSKTLSDNEVRVYREVVARYTKQKQAFDIAKTYENFISRHPLVPETAEFSSSLIQVYVDAGYASDIIRAKQDYVKRFAVNGSYYAQASAPLQASLKTQLKTHLTDLAGHYYAIAQSNKNPASYLTAANLYTDLLALTDLVSERTPITETLANVWFEAKAYEKAISYYTQLAYSNVAAERSKNPENAGYFILSSLQAIRAPLTVPQQRPWVDKLRDSAFSYAQNFAQIQGKTNPEAYTILSSVSADYVAYKDYAAVTDVANQTLKLTGLTAEQKRDTSILRANALYDQKLWKEAELGYRTVLRFSNLNNEQNVRYSNQLAATLYEQALLAEKTTDLKGASGLFIAASEITKDPSVQIDARFQAADVWGDKTEAIPLLGDFYSRYPTAPQSANLLERIVKLQEKYQLWANSSSTYQKIYNRDYSSNNANALAALWLAAVSERKATGDITDEVTETLKPTAVSKDTLSLTHTLVQSGEPAQRSKPASVSELALYQHYLSEPNAQLTQVLEASYQLLLDAKRRNNTADIAAAHQRHWQMYQQLANNPSKDADSANRLRYLAGQARIALDAPFIAQYMALPITQPLKASIGQKQAALKDLVVSQKALLDMNIAEFVGRAYYTLGEGYTNFYQGVINAPKPQGFDELELEQYDLTIEEQVQPLKDKALEFHKNNAALATDKDKPIWDNWIAKSFDTLAVISAGNFSRQVKPPITLAGDTELAQAIAPLVDSKNQTFAAGANLSSTVTQLDALIAKRQLDEGYFATRNRAKNLEKLGIDVDSVKLAQTYWYKGLVQLRMAQFSQALTSLRLASKTDPKMAEAYLLAGSIEDVYIGNKKSALSDYQQALSINSDDKNTQKWINITEKTLGLAMTKFSKPKPVSAETAAEPAAASK